MDKKNNSSTEVGSITKFDNVIKNWSTLKGSKDRNSSKNSSLKLVHEIFDKFSEHITDSFWKEIFVDVSKGRLPKGGFSINNNYLIFKNKHRVTQIEIEKDPMKWALYVDFIRKYGDIYSDTDIIEQKKKEIRILSIPSIYELKWSEIKKKDKEIIFKNFIISMKDMLNLDLKRTSQLEGMINYGLMFKKITDKNIIFEDGRITSIKGLVINEYNNEFYISDEYEGVYNNKQKNESIPSSIYLDPNRIVNMRKIVNVGEVIKRVLIKSFYPEYYKNYSSTTTISSGDLNTLQTTLDNKAC